jgi:uncharacterized protein (TIGR03086 family)
MTETSASELDDLSTVLAEAGRLIGNIASDQWSSPTPCAEWDLRQLVGHLVGGNQRFAAMLSADTPPSGPPPRAPLTELSDDPKADFDASADALLTAFALPGKLEAELPSPFGQVTGAVLVRLRITEAMTHGWDIAQATGQQPRFPAAVARTILTFSEQYVGRVAGDRSPFGPPVSVDSDADPLDRLVALLGRQPGWTAPR